MRCTCFRCVPYRKLWPAETFTAWWSSACRSWLYKPRISGLILRWVKKYLNLVVGKSQQEQKSVDETREIATARIHAERVIGLLRNKFTIFQGILPSKMIMKTDDGTCKLTHILAICSALCNLCSSVIPVEYVSWNSKKQSLWDCQSYAEIYCKNLAACNFTKMNFFSDISQVFPSEVYIWLYAGYTNHFFLSPFFRRNFSLFL